MSEPTDEELVAAYLKGDQPALELLVGRYLNLIYSFISRFIGHTAEAEDLTQTVFVKMWRSLKKFNQQKSFKTWIFSIAKNTAIDFLRQKKLAVSFSEFETEEGDNPIVDGLADPSPLPDEIFAKNNLADLLSAALAKLTPQYRLVLLLHYNDHFTFQEIAQTLSEPLNTVKSRHRRALIILRRLLAEKDF